MKYLQKFNPYYSVLQWYEYEDILFDHQDNLKVSVFPLNYNEQELIINLFKTKFNVTESLDYTLSIDNEVVIGFNRVDPEICCWINIGISEICITKLEDEWFLVRGVMTELSSEEAKCDQISGLLEYFKDRFKL